MWFCKQSKQVPNAPEHHAHKSKPRAYQTLLLLLLLPVLLWTPVPAIPGPLQICRLQEAAEARAAALEAQQRKQEQARAAAAEAQRKRQEEQARKAAEARAAQAEAQKRKQVRRQGPFAFCGWWF